jgi:DNA-binding GntR family transcriptional regulator
MADDTMHLVEARAALLATVLRVAARTMDDAGYAMLRRELLEIGAVAEKRSTPAARAMVEACETALTDLMLHRPHAR